MPIAITPDAEIAGHVSCATDAAWPNFAFDFISASAFRGSISLMRAARQATISALATIHHDHEVYQMGEMIALNTQFRVKR